MVVTDGVSTVVVFLVDENVLDVAGRSEGGTTEFCGVGRGICTLGGWVVGEGRDEEGATLGSGMVVAVGRGEGVMDGVGLGGGETEGVQRTYTIYVHIRRSVLDHKIES